MKLNRTTLHTVEMLKLVSRKSDNITLGEIYAKLDMPKTSTYDIMTTLVQIGMIHVVREQKQRYTVGLTAYRIGIDYTNSLDFISAIDPVFKTFSREVGKAVFFGIRSGNSVVYICKFEPENPIITTTAVGTGNLIYHISLGKAVMAHTENESRNGVLSRISFKKHIGRTICTREKLERESESMQKKGYAFNAREPEEYVECVGALVFGQNGDVMGAISVSSLYKPTGDYDALGRPTNDKRAQLPRLLGYIRRV